MSSKMPKHAADVPKRYYFYYVLAAVAIVFVDQLTKHLIKSGGISADWGWLAITYVTNTGAGFGLFKNSGSLLLWLSIVVFGVLLYYLPDMKKATRWCIVLIMSGILGNVIDRIHYGFVVDFINLKWWPVFNVADSSIFIGVICLIVFLWKEDRNKAKK